MCHQVRKASTWWAQWLMVQQREPVSAVETDWSGSTASWRPRSHSPLSTELYELSFPLNLMNWQSIVWFAEVCVTPACICFSAEEELRLSDSAGHWQWERVLLHKEEDAHPSCAGRVQQPPSHSQDLASGERKWRVRLPAEAREAAGHTTDRWEIPWWKHNEMITSISSYSPHIIYTVICHTL